MTDKLDSKTEFNRRDLLKGAAAAGLATVLSPMVSDTAPGAPAKKDMVRAENDKQGTSDWLLEKTRVDPKTRYRCPWIEGHCSQTSIKAGDALSIMVSTNPASSFVIDLYRLGYYTGKAGRHLHEPGPSKGKTPPKPTVAHRHIRPNQCGAAS